MTTARRGFTLIELLVSLALTLFILGILAEAFTLGADTFATLKVIGDLNGSLRTAANRIRADLAADHFEAKRRLSDSRFWYDGPPQQGYFYLALPPAGDDQGGDPDGFLSRTRIGHKLAFTIKARGNRPQDYFTAQLWQGSQLANPLFPGDYPDGRFQQPGQFNSQWAEVSYFLGPPIGVNLPGPPLFALYRQQRLVVANVDPVNWPTTFRLDKQKPEDVRKYFTKISCQIWPDPLNPFSLYFNSPADLTIPNSRTRTFAPLLDFATAAATGKPPEPSGEDLLLTDVLSFDVQVLLRDGADFIDLPPMVELGGGCFDTWSRRRDERFNYSGTNPPSQYTIAALQITLRIWEAKSKTTRQVTIVQDM